MNWLTQQASKADPSKDLAILEEPKTRDHLDDLLTTYFAPRIWSFLRATGYKVLPDVPVINSELSHILMRKLDFMLFDYHDYPFLRGSFSVNKDGWMLERTFSLGLPRDTKPSYLFKIIGDARFAGMPPTLEIQDSNFHPEWDTHFFITFKAGNGTSLGSQVIIDHALTSVKNVIATSQQMYNMAMADKLSSNADVEKFLKVAAIGYGAS